MIFAEWVHFDPALFRLVLLSAKKCSFQGLQFTSEGNPVSAKHKTHHWPLIFPQLLNFSVQFSIYFTNVKVANNTENKIKRSKYARSKYLQNNSALCPAKVKKFASE